jgi:hypothetical protein
MEPDPTPRPSGPLDPAERARGRRLAITSHPGGMTFRTVFADDLPTLALVALGASESLIGLQRALVPLGQLLQLPTLRAIGRYPMRSILVFGQSLGVAGAAPLALYGAIAALEPTTALAVVMGCLAIAAAGICITSAVWFPLLRGYTEPDRVGRFFGTLRAWWHLVLIVYFAGAQAWLTAYPGRLGPLFALGALAGAFRIGAVARLPERREKSDAPIRVREALAFAFGDPRMRRYLAGIGLSVMGRAASIPFVIVMMRRVLGFSDADVILATIATYAGGLVSLYPWGRAVDRFGAAPVYAVAVAGHAVLLLALLGVGEGTPGTLALLVAFFFLVSVFGAGFGVADTHVLFAIVPADSPARGIVIASVILNLLGALAPIGVGLAIERALARGVPALDAYHALFAAGAAVYLCAYLPLRGFRRGALEG